MDLLGQIWTAWNDQWGVTVATILGIIAIAMNAGEKFHKMWSTVRRWKAWPTVLRMCKSSQRKYRLRRAKLVLLKKVEQTTYRIPIQTYGSCLEESRAASPRDLLVDITPENPSWMNDYYFATALQLLFEENLVTKATLYETNGFPPRPISYYFEHVKKGQSARERSGEIETESLCVVYQCHLMCRESPRYEAIFSSETVSPSLVSGRTSYKLLPDSPPCVRCWDKIQRERDVSGLVENITTNDLRAIVTVAVTGEKKEFQKAVIETCIESDCPVDAPTIKKIVEQGVEIRRRQLELISAETQTNWDEQGTADFVSALSAYISDLRAEDKVGRVVSSNSASGKDMMKKIQIFQVSYCLMLLAACLLVGLAGIEPKVSAPLLTFMGGLIVIIFLLPQNRPSLREIGVLTGTLVIAMGSYVWYSSAVPAQERDGIIAILGIFIAFYGGILGLVILWIVNVASAVRDWRDRKRPN